MTDRTSVKDFYLWQGGPLRERGWLGVVGSFTKSNGTVMSRIYERLTKRSRRNEQSGLWPDYGHDAYRQGVYDTLKALQEELR